MRTSSVTSPGAVASVAVGKISPRERVARSSFFFTCAPIGARRVATSASPARITARRPRAKCSPSCRISVPTPRSPRVSSRYQIAPLPSEFSEQILFLWGHDPDTLACKARPSFDGCGTSLSVSLSLSLSLLCQGLARHGVDVSTAPCSDQRATKDCSTHSGTEPFFPHLHRSTPTVDLPLRRSMPSLIQLPSSSLPTRAAPHNLLHVDRIRSQPCRQLTLLKLLQMHLVQVSPRRKRHPAVTVDHRTHDSLTRPPGAVIVTFQRDACPAASATTSYSSQHPRHNDGHQPGSLGNPFFDDDPTSSVGLPPEISDQVGSAPRGSAEATIEMSLRLLGGTEESVTMESLESLESEDEREKKRKLEGKSTRPCEDAMFSRREIIDAIKGTNEKIQTYSNKADENMKN